MERPKGLLVAGETAMTLLSLGDERKLQLTDHILSSFEEISEKDAERLSAFEVIGFTPTLHAAVSFKLLPNGLVELRYLETFPAGEMPNHILDKLSEISKIAEIL